MLCCLGFYGRRRVRRGRIGFDIICSIIGVMDCFLFNVPYLVKWQASDQNYRACIIPTVLRYLYVIIGSEG